MTQDGLIVQCSTVAHSRPSVGSGGADLLHDGHDVYRRANARRWAGTPRTFGLRALQDGRKGGKCGSGGLPPERVHALCADECPNLTKIVENFPPDPVVRKTPTEEPTLLQGPAFPSGQPLYIQLGPKFLSSVVGLVFASHA